MRARACGALLLLVLLSQVASAAAAPAAEPALRAHADNLSTWTLLGEQVIGPLPAVASTPFFGLALLSGVGLVTDVGFVRDTRWSWLRSVRDNALVAEARHYSTWPRFLALAALALVGYFANSGKLQGLLGKGFRIFEDSSVLVGYTLLAIAAMPGGDEGAKVASAGVSGGAGLLIPLATMLALAAMMTVRFAFDVLIWLSPFPFVDLLFETAKKLVTLGVLLLYATSPALSALLCVVVLVATGFVAGWALRVLELYRKVIVNPILGAWLPAFFPRPLDEAEARRCGLDPRLLTLAAPAVALSLRGLPARSGGLVTVGFRRRAEPVAGPMGAPSQTELLRPQTPDGPGFCRFEARGFRSRSTHDLVRRPGERLHIGRALLWIELRVVDDRGIRDRIVFSRSLEPAYERIRDATGAADLGSLGALGLIETAGEVAGRKLAEVEDSLR
ncbi:MAG: hypothetical protein NDJ94_10160 [Vicinamibacteria bacterium]|nr:hypothetical protein [Vicinamibacteria bacterium]